MGTLKPDTKYVYEKADGITYAREFGAHPSTRVEIGRDYDRTLKDEIRLMEEIVRASKYNSALQIAIDNVKIIYHMSKEHGQK